MKLDHVAFQVSDLEAAIRFYQEALGLRLMFHQTDPEHHEAFAFLELDGGNLELLQCLDEENHPVPMPRPEIRPPYSPHVAIAVEGIDTWPGRLRDKGVEWIKGPMEIPGQVKWLYFADPDGNILELVEWQKQPA